MIFEQHHIQDYDSDNLMVVNITKIWEISSFFLNQLGFEHVFFVWKVREEEHQKKSMGTGTVCASTRAGPDLPRMTDCLSPWRSSVGPRGCCPIVSLRCFRRHEPCDWPQKLFVLRKTTPTCGEKDKSQLHLMIGKKPRFVVILRLEVATVCCMPFGTIQVLVHCWAAAHPVGYWTWCGSHCNQVDRGGVTWGVQHPLAFIEIQVTPIVSTGCLQ